MSNNIFDRWNDAIRNTESSLVNLLSAIAPWGAPLAPAVMSYRGMTTHLSFDPITAGIISGVIEVLGLATVHTTLLFWRHNRRYSADVRKMPTQLAAGMFGLYLLVILTNNVILEAFSVKLITWAWTPIAARALLSLLAVPAAVTMAIRSQHTELLHEIQSNRMRNQVQQDATKNATEVAKSNRVRILELHYSQPEMKPVAIAKAVNVSRQYVEKVISQNGAAKHEP